MDFLTQEALAEIVEELHGLVLEWKAKGMGRRAVKAQNAAGAVNGSLQMLQEKWAFGLTARFSCCSLLVLKGDAQRRRGNEAKWKWNLK